MTKKTSKPKKTTSRDEYDRNNPPFTVRLPVDVKRSILQHLKTMNMSRAEGFRVMAGDLEILERAFEGAEEAAYERAKAEYGVPFACNVCEKPIFITDPEAKRLAGEYLTGLGWGHAECHGRKTN